MTSGSQPGVKLLTISGPDRPGIASSILKIFADQSAELLDIGQAVLRGHLSLSVLYQCANAEVIETALRAQAKTLGLEISVQGLCPAPLLETNVRNYRYALTLMGAQLKPQALADLSDLLAKHKINIDRLDRLTSMESKDFVAFELALSAPRPINEGHLKQELLRLGTSEGLDLALQEEGLYRRSKRMIAFDMDSTLILNEGIDELAQEKGVHDQVSKITADAMAGKMDFEESLRQRIALLKDLDAQALERVLSRIQLTPGAKELIQVLKLMGFKVGVISGGFDFIAKKIGQELHFDFSFTNTLEIKNGKLTGKVLDPIINAQKKADHLVETAKRFQISLAQVIAVGDGANDLLMIEKAGLGVAFCAKPMLCEKADLSLQSKNLRTVLFLLGISEEDLKKA